MKEIIGVRFRDGGKTYSFDPVDFSLSVNDYVVVETARGTELGIVTEARHNVSEDTIVAPLRKVLRVATAVDIKNAEELRQKEKDSIGICQRKIDAHNLEMKVINADYAFDGSKIIFYFIADGRVDFRNLVKDLASVFKTRIELRQVGVRDEAKMLGGLGICGRPFCCASFLDDFQPVSIKMAKEQNLSLNQTKISGTCGRLMCCLKYEQEAYEDLIKSTPKIGADVSTPYGDGTVIDVSLLTGKVRVKFNDESDSAPKTFDKSEVTRKCPENCSCPNKKADKKNQKAPAEPAEAEK